MLDYWATASRTSRAALVCAGVALTVHSSTYFGVTSTGVGVVFYPLHLAVMGLFLVTFEKLYRYRTLRGALDPNALGVVPAVSPAWPAFGAALIALINLSVVSQLSERTATGAADSDFLRLFSAAWLFFALAISFIDHIVARRLGALQDRFGIRKSAR